MSCAGFPNHARFVAFMKAQREAIEEYKWVESEKAGRDLGQQAQLEWVRKFAKTFREDYKKMNKIINEEYFHPELKVQLLYKDSKKPVKKYETDSGYDVFAHNWKFGFTRGAFQEETVKADSKGQLAGMTAGSKLTLNPGERALIGVGIAATVGAGWEIQVRPRSGVSLWNGCTVLNTPGTVDEAYRGEIGVIIVNHSLQSQTIDLEERIAQIVVAPIALPTLSIVTDLDDTERGDGGYNSTGTK